MSSNLNQKLQEFRVIFNEMRELAAHKYFDRTQLLQEIKHHQEQINAIIKYEQQQQHHQSLRDKILKTRFIPHQERQSVKLRTVWLEQGAVVDENCGNNEEYILRRETKMEGDKLRLKQLINANSLLCFEIELDTIHYFESQHKITTIPKLNGNSQWLNFNQLTPNQLQNINVHIYHLNKHSTLSNIQSNNQMETKNLSILQKNMQYQHTDIHGNHYTSSQINQPLGARKLKMKMEHLIYSDNYEVIITQLIQNKFVILCETQWHGIIGRCDLDYGFWVEMMEQQKNSKKKRDVILYIKKLSGFNTQQTYLNNYPLQGELLFTLKVKISILVSPLHPPLPQLLKLNAQKFYQKNLRHKKVLSKSPSGKSRQKSPLRTKQVLKSLMDQFRPVEPQKIIKSHLNLIADKKSTVIQLKVRDSIPIVLGNLGLSIYDDISIVFQSQKNISHKEIRLMQNNKFLCIYAKLVRQQVERSPKKKQYSSYHINRNYLAKETMKQAPEAEQSEGTLVFKLLNLTYQVTVIEDDNFKFMDINQSKITLKKYKPEEYHQINSVIKLTNFVYIRPNFDTKIHHNPLQQIVTQNCIAPYFIKTDLALPPLTSTWPTRSQDLPLQFDVYPAINYYIKCSDNGYMLYYIIPQSPNLKYLKEVQVIISIRQKPNINKKIGNKTSVSEMHYFSCKVHECRYEVAKQIEVQGKGMYNLDVSSIVRKGSRFIVRSMDETVFSVVTVFVDQSHNKPQSYASKSQKSISDIQVTFQLKQNIEYQKHIRIILDDVDKLISTAVMVRLFKVPK